MPRIDMIIGYLIDDVTYANRKLCIKNAFSMFGE